MENINDMKDCTEEEVTASRVTTAVDAKMGNGQTYQQTINGRMAVVLSIAEDDSMRVLALGGIRGSDIPALIIKLMEQLNISPLDLLAVRLNRPSCEKQEQGGGENGPKH